MPGNKARDTLNREVLEVKQRQLTAATAPSLDQTKVDISIIHTYWNQATNAYMILEDNYPKDQPEVDGNGHSE